MALLDGQKAVPKREVCRDLLGRGEHGHVRVGHNVMRASAWNGMNTHASWHQVS